MAAGGAGAGPALHRVRVGTARFCGLGPVTDIDHGAAREARGERETWEAKWRDFLLWSRRFSKRVVPAAGALNSQDSRGSRVCSRREERSQQAERERAALCQGQPLQGPPRPSPAHGLRVPRDAAPRTSLLGR